MSEHTGSAADQAWDGLQQMWGDLTRVVREDARDDRERREGYRVLARVMALATELTLDVDPARPRFFAMSTPMRQIGGPNPDGEYDLATLAPGGTYRISGTRGSVTYLGFQVMAGIGLTPRRHAAYLSDSALHPDAAGRFAFVLGPTDPGTGDPYLAVPDDASAVVVRQYIGDRGTEELATYAIERLDRPAAPGAEFTDDAAAEQITGLTWTAWKLMTLHRTVLPELLEHPNELRTAEAAALGSENTTPDNLYMIGSYDLADGRALLLDLVPPTTRYWSITLESVWHECADPFHRRSSGTDRHLTPGDDGRVRVAIAASDPGVTGTDTHWLDTGGRSRGFVILRWLDHPAAPEVVTSVRSFAELSAR